MSADGSTIELILPSAQSDIDEAYDEALHQLKTRPRLTPKAQTAGEKQAECMDYYRNVRTNVLLAWALSNVRPCSFFSLYLSLHSFSASVLAFDLYGLNRIVPRREGRADFFEMFFSPIHSGSIGRYDPSR